MRQQSSSNPPTEELLKIGEVSRLVGVSPSIMRAWERLGLIRPRRTDSGYRKYARSDVQLLKRARYLRRERGLNAPAIAEVLKSAGRGAGLPATAPNEGASRVIGARLRRLRLARKLALVEVAKAVGISVGFLSGIERSQMSASVATLRKLARFYKTSILDFFEPQGENPHLVRAGERKVLDAGQGVKMELLAWGKAVMEPHLFRIAPKAGSGEAYTHEGEEFLHVLAGALTISLEGRDYLLRHGDSLYFDSNIPHRWVNPGLKEAAVLWINTPPTF